MEIQQVELNPLPKTEFTLSKKVKFLGREKFDKWLKSYITNYYSKIFFKLEEFLMTVGRRKFLLRIYTALLFNNAYKKFAKTVYKTARKNDHYVSTNSLDKLMD